MRIGEKSLKTILLVVVFVAGIFAGQMWNFYSPDNGITGSVVNVPSDFIDDREIFVYEDRVVISVEGATLSNYEDTGSMIPVLGMGVNGITVRPGSEEDIDVGDIVSFRRDGDLIVHRVVEKGVDSSGVYFITKGDNSLEDDGKIRFEDIEKVLVGLIY